MTPDTPPIGVLIVDDHPVFRHGLRDILESSPGLRCIGECASASEAMAAVHTLMPDVILMDIRMSGLDGKAPNGLEATATIKRTAPGVKVIILSMIDSADAVSDAFASGASGYLIKDAGKRELIEAIREVVSGGTPISPHIKGLQGIFRPPQKPSTDLVDDNSERMREVMNLLAQGLTNDEITHRLVLAPKTIRNYVSRVIQIVGAESRRDAIMRLREKGYGLKKPGSPEAHN